MTASADGPRPILEGLLTEPLSDLSKVHVGGSRCSTCGETSLGAKDICPNCGQDTVKHIPLSDDGTLWTYTVVRHKPPGAYYGPDPFKPFGLGLVELPDGLRIMAPIDGDPDSFSIGMKLKLRPYILRTDEAGRDVVAFSYAPA
jgi:uncharacterized OB-fold protein